jgi:hypothetical protein
MRQVRTSRTSRREDEQVHQLRQDEMNWIPLLQCFGAGAFGMLAMFVAICLIPEIEDFFKKKK